MKRKITYFFITAILLFCSTFVSSQELPKLKLMESSKGLFKSTSTFLGNKSQYSKISLSSAGLNEGEKKLTLSGLSEKNIRRYFNEDFPKRKGKGEYIPWESRKHFWVATGEMALLEFIPFAMSAYIKDWEGVEEVNWTKISFKSMWHNLSSGWFYDGDNFLTNFFAHPYHGSLFYNAGRANGFNFWESSLFSMAGSAWWEHFMETWEPAFNDWVLTSINGITLGEMTYRLSTLVTDNQARGSTRMWLEIAGAVINPVRGFNRLISGETSRIFPNPTWRTPDNISLTLSAGARKLDKNNGEDFANESIEEGVYEMQFSYGSVLKSDFKTPFSNFHLKLAVSSGTPHLTQLQGYGHLYGIEFKKSKNHRHYLIETLNYDYDNNPGFLFGSASLATIYANIWNISKTKSYRVSPFVRIIPMGATPDDYFAGPEGRNYDFGPGLGAGIESAYTDGRWDIVSVRYNAGMIWTQSDPPDSRHFLQYLNLEFQYPMKDYFVIGLSAGGYMRNSYYINNNDVTFKTPVVRVFFKTAIL